MLGRKHQTEATTARLAEVTARQREDALRADLSTIPGMTQAELNDVISSGTIPTALLRDVLNH